MEFRGEVTGDVHLEIISIWMMLKVIILNEITKRVSVDKRRSPSTEPGQSNIKQLGEKNTEDTGYD